MLFAAGPISDFVDRHPTVKMLALSFLLLIGMSLVAEGFDQHIPKGYIYFAMAFSVSGRGAQPAGARQTGGGAGSPAQSAHERAIRGRRPWSVRVRQPDVSHVIVTSTPGVAIMPGLSCGYLRGRDLRELATGGEELCTRE